MSKNIKWFYNIIDDKSLEEAINIIHEEEDEESSITLRDVMDNKISLEEINATDNGSMSAICRIIEQISDKKVLAELYIPRKVGYYVCKETPCLKAYELNDNNEKTGKASTYNFLYGDLTFSGIETLITEYVGDVLSGKIPYYKPKEDFTGGDLDMCLE